MTLDRDTVRWLRRRFGKRVRFDEPMSRRTYFRVGGAAEAYLRVDSRKQLLEVLARAVRADVPYLIAGGGTNLLVGDGGIEGLVIVLGKGFRRIARVGADGPARIVSAMSAARLATLCTFALENALAGMNFAVGIPGTVGGAISMNAGTAAGCMADVLSRIEAVLPPSEPEAAPAAVAIPREELDFEYRRLSWNRHCGPAAPNRPVITAGQFRLLPADAAALRRQAAELRRRREHTQPSGMPSAGCVFKNPSPEQPAGRLIEAAGLKGATLGGARVSSRHANFIVNTGNASAADILALMDRVREAVWRRFGIKLETEVQIVGNQTQP